MPCIIHEKRNPFGLPFPFQSQVVDLAVATVDRLALVRLAADASIVDELLDSLVEGVDEIATGAHALLGEGFLYTSSYYVAHRKRGRK